MAAPKRTEAQVERDSVLITDLFVKNYTLKEIAAQVNERAAKESLGYSITFQQVHYDIKKILAEWKELRTDFIDDILELELAKLDRIEKECWEGWEKSKTAKLRTKIEGGVVNQQGTMSGGSVKERTIETTPGDVRFLDRIQGCIDKRIEILGLAKPKKVQISSDPDAPIERTDEALIEELSRIEKALKELK